MALTTVANIPGCPHSRPDLPRSSNISGFTFIAQETGRQTISFPVIAFVKLKRARQGKDIIYIFQLRVTSSDTTQPRAGKFYYFLVLTSLLCLTVYCTFISLSIRIINHSQVKFRSLITNSLIVLLQYLT